MEVGGEDSIECVEEEGDPSVDPVSGERKRLDGVEKKREGRREIVGVKLEGTRGGGGRGRRELPRGRTIP